MHELDFHALQQSHCASKVLQMSCQPHCHLLSLLRGFQQQVTQYYSGSKSAWAAGWPAPAPPDTGSVVSSWCSRVFPSSAGWSLGLAVSGVGLRRGGCASERTRWMNDSVSGFYVSKRHRSSDARAPSLSSLPPAFYNANLVFETPPTLSKSMPGTPSHRPAGYLPHVS